MSLHPILALEHVIDEYRDYLRSEFRAKDPGLREALERELDRPLFLAQEPFFQAHRPFRTGRRWAELPIDPKLARVMETRAGSDRAYLHQSEAVAELLAPAARPIVVTTGTGSGKTEAFLLPVLQNAIEDATRFARPGLTAVLVYPMNALANDQLLRIDDYLQASGFSGTVKVARYDRGTTQQQRAELRASPPHILLTNYMMLEYLLVRPADREAIFANHRCRFLVLDEVHTYRGTLGSNIALLVRRLRAHLSGGRQDWGSDVTPDERVRRYPTLVSVGTSATIKSVTDDVSRDEALRLRDLAVQEFFAKLTGVDANCIRVLGEEIEEIHVPEDATYPAVANVAAAADVTTPEHVRRALADLTGLAPDTPMAEAARRCRLLWDLNRWLVAAPMSVSQLAERLRSEVAARANADVAALHREIEAGLSIGAALPDGTPGALRLRAHRFVRGGWRFHRCINPECGRLYPMGEERCECGHPTAPLYLCRACGADYLRLVGDPDDGPLRPSAGPEADQEWLVFEHGRFADVGADDEADEDGGNGGTFDAMLARGRKIPKQIRKRPVLRGSLDPSTLLFSASDDYPLKVTLAPARTRCLCCGGTAGSRNILTPVSLGTSAAVKVMAEGLLEALDAAARDTASGDGKQRLLIFSDSRQDAAHQARFIIFASRYDRMRRALVGLLEREGRLSLQRAVELLGERAVQERDNPFVPEETGWLQAETLARIRAYEEAPLLDDLAITAGYRATVLNLGLVGAVYDGLVEYVAAGGRGLAGTLGLTVSQFEYVCRCVLDDMRVRGAVSRELLRYHPAHPSYPEYCTAARWERRITLPQGFPCDTAGTPLAYLDPDEIPPGLKVHNAWRKPGAGGSGPRVERIFKSLLARLGGVAPDEQAITACLKFLKAGGFVVASELFGFKQKRHLLQVNSETIRLVLVREGERRHCSVCGNARPFTSLGMPCPLCHGHMGSWPDDEVARHRSVRRIRADRTVPLVAGEHTAQVPNASRMELEEDFKAAPALSKVNVLACSPTLEMGIDVGGLDAVALRNVPPRPDNYAQRGGRAGRRTRVGLVLGYARSTPHDQYFYDKPVEMIAGEVPAPVLALGNRDVILRHVSAIVFSNAVPGLDGRMVKYVSPTGEIQAEAVEALIAGLAAQFEPGLTLARAAFGDEILSASTLDERALRAHLEALPARVRDLVERTARQVKELRQALDAYTVQLLGKQAATKAGDLVARLLGIASEKQPGGDADDRSAGYPLRRFAEFGILPGYEFPTEPASLRLLGDKNEEEPVTVARRFGIAQFQPDASVFARTGRWRVIGLDTASPWNPRGDAPAWSYRLCRSCGLRFGSDHPKCPRCGGDQPGPCLPAAEFGGFVARRDESPVLDEEERFAVKNLVRANPQWDGEVVGRWDTPGAWALRLSRGEDIRWLNEGMAIEAGRSEPNALHSAARGYLLCGSCGRMLSIPEPTGHGKGTPKPRGKSSNVDQFGHRADCPKAGATPKALAITTCTKAEVLRLLAAVPASLSVDDVKPWALSLGYALRIGIRHLYMLDGPEVEFELEGPWNTGADEQRIGMVSLSFIDGSLGGTGYLARAAAEMHLVARRAIQHLDHPGCETACYRCLKSYANQRFHEYLRWPLAAPALEALAFAPTVARGLQTGDLDDPGPWLEAYAAGVGSPLELKFLRLFEKHGFHPEKQVPIGPADDERPISIADFAVPAARLAIYIDGAAVHTGANLRRDRAIRARLRGGTPPWRVEELRAADLADGANLVKRLAGGVGGV